MQPFHQKLLINLVKSQLSASNISQWMYYVVLETLEKCNLCISEGRGRTRRTTEESKKAKARGFIVTCPVNES